MQSSTQPSDTVAARPAASALPRSLAGVATGIALLAPLSWLLARLIWLWFCFGLFFFLIATLIVGSCVFRVLRPLRPRSRAYVAGLCVVIAGVTWMSCVAFEFRHIAATIGEPPRFTRARTAFVSAGRRAHEVDELADRAFRDALARNYSPGGVIGYVRWAATSGTMSLTLPRAEGVESGPFADQCEIQHRRHWWLLRAAVAFSFLFLGLWWQLVDLCAAAPVRNLIDAELGDELEREELREAGEPGFVVFEHTADIGLEARGRNWPGLLEQAARGLMATIGRLKPASTPTARERIELQAPTREDLLHDWLAELLYRFETRGVLPDRITFHAADDTRLSADIVFRPVDQERSVMLREVKAVTYHDLTITPIKRGLSARVILDI